MQQRHIHWRLVYDTGRIYDERAITDSSIRDRPPGRIQEIQLCVEDQIEGKPIRTPFCRVPMQVDGEGDYWLPVFYRKKGGTSGRDWGSTEAVVFGKVHKAWEQLSVAPNLGMLGANCTLWAYIGGQQVGCPQWALDPTMVELQRQVE